MQGNCTYREDTKMAIKKGDRIIVKNFCKKYNGEKGTVDSVNGLYVNVFLDCQPFNKSYPFELLWNEVDLI